MDAAMKQKIQNFVHVLVRQSIIIQKCQKENPNMLVNFVTNLFRIGKDIVLISARKTISIKTRHLENQSIQTLTTTGIQKLDFMQETFICRAEKVYTVSFVDMISI